MAKPPPVTVCAHTPYRRRQNSPAPSRANPPARPRTTRSTSPSQPRSMARLMKKATPNIRATTPMRASQLPPTSHSQFQPGRPTAGIRGTLIPPPAAPAACRITPDSTGSPRSRPRSTSGCPAGTGATGVAASDRAASGATGWAAEGSTVGGLCLSGSGGGCVGARVAPGVRNLLSRSTRRRDRRLTSETTESRSVRNARSSRSLAIGSDAVAPWASSPTPEDSAPAGAATGSPHHGQ